MDGIVLWSSLVEVTHVLGPVELCIGSHRDGVRRVHTRDPRNPGKSGAYALILEGEDAVVAGYARAAPLTSPGDLVVIDFLTVHASGRNQGKRARWSMQLRYFNFQDPTGMRIGWRGSYAAGIDFRTVHPDLAVD
jgi:ectoine hydroxylase-related dioxygenase (phytanoyl-CoA dioxygenase family)